MIHGAELGDVSFSSSVEHEPRRQDLLRGAVLPRRHRLWR
jgi:hypothetical protein